MCGDGGGGGGGVYVCVCVYVCVWRGADLTMPLYCVAVVDIVAADVAIQRVARSGE